MSNGKPGGPGKDIIEITYPDGEKREVIIPTAEFIIGREQGNPFSINDAKASRQHAQICLRNSGYQVNDLNSLNGTYLAGQKLLAGNSDPWQPNKELRIGSHKFRLILNQGPPDRPEPLSMNYEEYVTQGEINPPPPQKVPLKDDELRIELSESEKKIVPGQPAIFTVTLTNLSTLTAHYDLRVSGLPEDWVSFSPGNPVQLMPATIGKNKQQQNTSVTVTVTITPPPTNKVRAGRFKFKVEALKDGSPGNKVEASGKLVIQPFGTLAAEMQHSQVPLGSKHRVIITNNSNASRNVSIQCRGETKDLDFSYKTQSMTIAANDRAIFEFGGKLRKRRWMGGEKQHRFKVKIDGDDFKSEMNGEFVSHGVIPRWLPPAVVLTVMAISGLLFRNYQKTQDANASATATAITATAVMNVTETAVSTESTATAAASETSSVATEIANQQLTATAAAQITQTAEAQNAIATADMKEQIATQTADAKELGVKQDLATRDAAATQAAATVTQDAILHVTETAIANATQTRVFANATSTQEAKDIIATQTAIADRAARDASADATAQAAIQIQQSRDATATENARIAVEEQRRRDEEIKAEIKQQEANSAATQTALQATIAAQRVTPTPMQVSMDIDAYCEANGYVKAILLSNDLLGWACSNADGSSIYQLTRQDFAQLCIEQYGPDSVPVTVGNTRSDWKCTK